MRLVMPDTVDALEQHVRAHDLQFLRISAVTGEGSGRAAGSLWKYLRRRRAEAEFSGETTRLRRLLDARERVETT